MSIDKSRDDAWVQQAKALVEAYFKGQTGSYGLSPQRILQVAREAVSRQGHVRYEDYDTDLLIGELNGVRPSKGAWRLFRIKQVLIDNSWRYEGRPGKFYPPS